jgi:ABC-type xylose transport system permease subunit
LKSSKNNFTNNVVVKVDITLITTLKKHKEMSILERLKAPTPKFYRVLRNLGLCLAAAGGVLVATPIAIPVAIVTLGGYLIVAGSVATAIAQTVVSKENY